MSQRLLATALGVLVVCVSTLVAQTPSGEISGVVTDASGAAVPGVTITLTNQATNAVREVQTNESGLYVMPAILPGLYTLKATLSGFRTARTARHRGADRQRPPHRGDAGSGRAGRGRGDHRRRAAAPDRELAVGTVIENRAIVELPLNGRNYLQLASLMPGATTNGPSSSQGKQRMGGQRNSFALNVAGQRIHYNHYSLDGVENTDLNFNSYMLLPSVDALQEFNVVAGLFDAEYGRAIAQINASTKSGTNQFHGTVFEFARNSALDAKNYFDRDDRPIPPFRRNQYGATLGGPVVLPKVIDGTDRLFFMFNWEGLRETKSLTSTPSVPLTAWRDRRLLEPARRQRQPDPHLRSGDARLRRGRQRDAGADAVPRQPHSRPAASIPISQAAARVLPAAAAGSGRRELRERRSAPRRTPTSTPTGSTSPRAANAQLVLPPQHLARARLRSVRDSRHGDQHRHRRAAGRARLHAHVRIEPA